MNRFQELRKSKEKMKICFQRAISDKGILQRMKKRKKRLLIPEIKFLLGSQFELMKYEL
jgi:gluconate kinase